MTLMRLPGRLLPVSCTCLLCGACLCGLAHGAEGGDSYSAILRKVVLEQRVPCGDFELLTSNPGVNPPGPRFIRIPRLDTPDAVPTLIQVLLNGPEWTQEELQKWGGIAPHLARCYAALCLGTTRDVRAFAPLVQILQSGDFMENKYTITYRWKENHNIRRYAAFALGELGDRRAVGPLVASLRTEGMSACIYALTRLRAVNAARTMIQVAAERNLFNVYTHLSLQYMLRVDFPMDRVNGVYQVAGLPVTSAGRYHDILKALWQYWVEAGDAYAKENFDRYYPEWKTAVKESPNAHDLHRAILKRMLRGGVAALPYVMARMEQEDQPLGPAIAHLTLNNNLKNADRSQALRWWQNNRQDWVVFDPNQ